MAEGSKESTLEARLVALEASLSFHQREYEKLNDVVIEQATRIDALHRKVAALESTLQEVKHQLPDDRDLADEKPPHY